MRQVTKRSLPIMEEEKLYEAPVFTGQHDTRGYVEATCHKLVIKEVINVTRRDNELRRQARYQDIPDEEIPLIPMEMDPYQRKVICTHGWAERDRSTRKRACHAQNALPDVGAGCQGAGRNMVPADSLLMSGIQLLVEAEAGISQIYDYIHSNSAHRVTMTDVRKMITRLWSTGKSLSDNDSVAEMILNFNVESTKNVTSVHESAPGDTGVISFTSGYARAMLDNFPEVIQNGPHSPNQSVFGPGFDQTFCLTSNNYQLLTRIAWISLAKDNLCSTHW
ncbi:Hypothetical protein PHPALM_9547 [Phytophthora palmivora]|uniref:Uncharacterized protein n=1 Tax=Phytophthora palmivora TaxID=4796 RepID=A0A2P4Y705_9STRA|nr:Hypothetical protein PHPALM_9547 [Phytophthora palmivora]